MCGRLHTGTPSAFATERSGQGYRRRAMRGNKLTPKLSATFRPPSYPSEMASNDAETLADTSGNFLVLAHASKTGLKDRW